MSLVKTRPRLWRPQGAREELWHRAPIVTGRVTLEVHREDGKLLQRRQGKNAVLPWLPYMLWSLLRPYNSTLDMRFGDGTLLYPAWTDVFLNTQTSGVSLPYAPAFTAPSTNTDGSYQEAVASPGPLAGMFGPLLMGTMFVGNFTGASQPSGNVSSVLASSLSIYSLIANQSWNLSVNRGMPLGSEANSGSLLAGPAVSSRTISGVAAPAAQTTISRTFATQAGTVNAVGFLPRPAFTSSSTLNPNSFTQGSYLRAWSNATAVTPPTLQAAFTPAAPSASWANATDNVVFSTLYVAGSPVNISAGNFLTVNYTLAVSL